MQRSSRRRFQEFLNERSSGLRIRGHDDGAAGRDEPEKKTGRSRTFFQLFVAFWGMLRGHRGAVVFALATLTVGTLLKLVPPLATKLTVDYVLTGKEIPAAWSERFPQLQNPFTLLLWIVAGVAVVSLASTAVHLWGRWTATKSVNMVQVSVRKRVFEHAVRLPLNRIVDLKSGGASSLLREDAGTVAELIFSMLYNPWKAIIQLAGSLIVLVFVDWRLMLGGVLLLPAVYFTHSTWIKRIRPLFRSVRRQRQEIDAHSTEAFGGMRVVRTFNRERSETGRFVIGNNLLIRQQLLAWWWSRIIEVIWDVLIPLASTGLLLYGGYQVLTGELTLGDLMMFLVYLLMLLEPLATLATSATTFQNSLAGLDRVLDLLAEPREMQATPASRTVDPRSVAGRITLEGVDFQYPATSQLVLREIDLEIDAGEMVALVGRSGAGKTTLCNLVARFYDPTAGMIAVDGIDLRDIEVESYRHLLGIVEQDVFLFDGTIAENIAYASRRAAREDIRAAAVAANAHEFILGTAEGYDTLIGERGVKLSGGQRQRLAIARAILSNPRILILDEATSNLDSESERLIQESLALLMEGRTSLVIAHRLSTIFRADRIIVLEDGRIMEAGSHDELMRKGGRYRRMVELQMGVEQRMA